MKTHLIKLYNFLLCILGNVGYGFLMTAIVLLFLIYLMGMLIVDTIAESFNWIKRVVTTTKDSGTKIQ
jgi:hypothetical protein